MKVSYIKVVPEPPWLTGFTVSTPIQALVEITSGAVRTDCSEVCEPSIHKSTAQAPLQVSVRGIEFFLAISVWAIWCHTFLTRLTLSAGDKLWKSAFIAYAKGTEEDSSASTLSYQSHVCYNRICNSYSASFHSWKQFILLFQSALPQTVCSTLKSHDP